MIYEFLCEKCGEKEEISLAITKRNEEQKCKFCEHILTRMIGTNQSFIFRGSGFYCTDYRKDN